jgi:hypothetical protein
MGFSFRISRTWWWIASLTVTAALVWFLGSRLDTASLGVAFDRLRWRDLLVLVPFWLAGVWARTCQLQRLLPVAVNFFPVSLIILVRNVAVDLLPARTLSLLAHTLMLRRFGQDSAVSGASFAVSTVLNAMSVVILLIPALLVAQGPFSALQFLAAVVILLALGCAFLFWGGLLAKLLARLPWPRWQAWGLRWQVYFVTMGRPRRLLVPFLYGFLSRLAKYLLLYRLFTIFAGLDFSLTHLPVFLLVLSGAELSSLLPISGIAGFGTWELAFVLTAGAMNLQTANPLEIGLLIHVVTQVWEGGWALLALLLFRIPDRQAGLHV